MEAEAGALPFADTSFEVVTACYLLHFLDEGERARIITEARRVLVPGGRLGVVTIAPPAGRISSLISRPVLALAERSRGVLAGLRPLDPRPELETAGLRAVSARRVRAGYPSLCVVAERRS
jgi:demethylmenaquinone methyltransferase/2-methoxy-6-polyprenyl-1,4-benzoquinol methylase